MQAIDPAVYDVTPVYISPSGTWHTGPELLNRAFYAKVPGNLSSVQEITLLPKPGLRGLTKLSDHSVIPIDVFLPAFHGQYGEDGCIQGLFELADVPYTGSNVVASAITMNKYACKMFLKEHGVPVLPAQLISRSDAQRDITGTVAKALAAEGYTLPLFVKPCNLGSSIGISKVKEASDLAPALAKVFRYDTHALVEPCVNDIMEINCSVRDYDGIHPSVIEIPVSDSGVLSYEEKYLRGGGKKSGPSAGMASLTRVIDPQDLDPEVKSKVLELAKRSFTVLGCSGVARLDFIVDLSSGALYFNELNAFPGSCSFYLWVRSNPRVLYTTLIHNMIETALKHHATAASLDRNIGLKALRS
jgi:D-alanine-D-alanine ligase